MHCYVTQLLRKYQMLLLCMAIAQCVQIVNRSHFQMGLESHHVDGAVEYLVLVTQWIPSVSLTAAVMEDTWWTGDPLQCIESLIEGVLAMP